MKRSDNRGFTLIELLVVIGIIAILASILFPVFARSREKARQASCISNQRQLGLAFDMYVNDYDGIYPGAPAGPSGAGVYGGWVWYAAFASPQTGPNRLDPTQGGLYPYVGNAQVYMCPSDATRSGLSFELNGNLRHAPEALVLDPANCILLAEEDQFGTANDGYFNVDTSPDPVIRRHNDGAVYTFADGHAKWRRWSNEETWADCALAAP